jgi:RHS repeat-associated protein
VRKVTDKAHAQGAQALKKEQRYYLGTVELYRSYDNAGDLAVERYTLHVSDDKQRIAMVDNRTVGQNGQPDAHLVRYQLPNHLSSASMEVDQTGRVISYEEHHPFGTTSYQARNATVNAAAKRYRFTAMERDEESGLEYHSARYYVPWLGRWLSPDKLGEKQKGNRYAYVNNNPLKFMDTNGMFEEPTHGALTYRLAIAAGFHPDDAAQIALATAAMDHDAADRPGDSTLETAANILNGQTKPRHYPSQAEAMARVERDIAPQSQGGGGAQDLQQLGRDLHSLEDVGTATNPGPHNRNPSGGPPVRHASDTLFTVGLIAGGAAAGLGYAAYLGVNWVASLSSTGDKIGAGILTALAIILAVALAAFAILLIVTSIKAEGTGHPTYWTERGRLSFWWRHTADQYYQDPEANRREMTEIYQILQRAARARYGPGHPIRTDDAMAIRAMYQLGEAQTMEEIDRYMNEPAMSSDGRMFLSYTEILGLRQGGPTWTPRDMDISVTGDGRTYKEFYDAQRHQQR